MIRVAAFDLDGTILERGRDIRPEVIETLRRMRHRGVRIVTATGRPIGFQLELLERFGLGEVFAGIVVDERELYLREGDELRPDRPWNDRMRARWAERLPAALHWAEAARVEADRRGMQATVDPADDIAERGLATIRLTRQPHAEAIDAWLRERLDGGPDDLTSNRNLDIVQIADATAGKAAVLTRLAAIWGLEPGEILAVGDSTNDLGMLGGAHGFRSATVANAAPAVLDAVRAAGGYLARGEAGLGVVEALLALVPEAAPAGNLPEPAVHLAPEA